MMNDPTDQLETLLKHVDGAEFVRALAALSPNAAIYAVDSAQNISFWSTGAEAITGHKKDDVMGRHCLSASRCVECLSSCGIRAHEVVNGAHLRVFHKDGSEIPVIKHARGFFSDDGSFLGGIELLLPLKDAARDEGRARKLPIVETDVFDGTLNFHGILTKSPEMQRILETVKNVARTDVTVLVRGASGSGKELVAHAIHNESHRRDGPFLAVNCAAMSPALLESELFGHEKGAFTGAVHQHRGLFERADEGTLFLDEVAELPLDLQAKLLRVLEERTFFRVGGTKPISVDVRVVSATHRSLRREVSLGKFREDLMYRLRVVPIFLPSLAERSVDVPLLTHHFVERLNARGMRHVDSIDPDVMRIFLGYKWPGNIRELKNAVEYAFAVAVGNTLTPQDLPRDFFESGPPLVAREADANMVPDEKSRIKDALAKADGHLGHAAELLGMSRPTLWRKRKKLGL